MGSTTPLYKQHLEAGAKIVDFGGWDMPLHYGSQIGEHMKVRQDVGMFDVSHMTLVDIKGIGSRAMLVKLLANDVRKLTGNGRALYSAMLNEDGCILDDLIVYGNGDDYLMVVNCGTREKDLNWISKQAEPFDCSVCERTEFAIIAVQGPNSIPVVEDVVGDDVRATMENLKVFQGQYCGRWFLARTGYTGEKGVEIVLPADDAVKLWGDLSEKGVQPIGLGARDTLRLEAGMNLYGSDMDESVTPLSSNMETTVVMNDHEFIGKAALQEQLQSGIDERLVGLIMTSRGVLRAHYPVYCDGQKVGETTSGAFSPTLQHSIALARVSETQGELTVAIRGKQLVVQEVTLPFVRNGRQVYKTQ
jgi:aminomethyltransferase|tara:strand:+ start:7008 stop:8090 length:1083 start_codon:yes stop_codon:yes gene_type:complete